MFSSTSIYVYSITCSCFGATWTSFLWNARRGVSRGLRRPSIHRFAGRPATGCVIKPAEQCLINESDEWRASNDDDDDPTLEIEVSRERERGERELRPRCITHLCARARSRRIVDINRMTASAPRSTLVRVLLTSRRVIFSRRRRSSVGGGVLNRRPSCPP